MAAPSRWFHGRMTDDAAESGAAPRDEEAPPPKRPWYASTGALIGAIVAGALGLVLLVAGIVVFTSASDTRAEADALAAEAEAVSEEAAAIRSQADAAQEAATALPGLVDEVYAQSDALLAASGATVDAFNALIACTNAATELGALQACFDGRVTDFQDAVDAELEAVKALDAAVAEAEAARDAAEEE